MVIIYDEYSADLYKFIRLNFDSGEYAITILPFGLARDYILKYRELGYTFIHR